MNAVKSAYRAVTRQIEVKVTPRFLPDRSSPENGYFFWAYTIMLTNLGRETVQQKALHLAHAVVIHNDITTADGEFDLFQNVTVEDVKRVANTYFTPQSRMLMTILPRGGESPGAVDRPLVPGAVR